MGSRAFLWSKQYGLRSTDGNAQDLLGESTGKSPAGESQSLFQLRAQRQEFAKLINDNWPTTTAITPLPHPSHEHTQALFGSPLD